MLHLLTDLTDWLVGFADTGWAIAALVASAFTEAIFFPIPPDALLIGMTILDPGAALWLAAVTTVSSVAGAFVGHWLGHRFGRPLIHRIISVKRVDAAERLFKKYGAWAIVVAAFTPLPYKVFTLTAGALGMDRRSFLVASIVGRGARFLLIGVLMFAYGEEMQEFISDRFEMVTVVATAALLAVALVVVVLAAKRRRAGSAVSPP